MNLFFSFCDVDDVVVVAAAGCCNSSVAVAASVASIMMGGGGGDDDESECDVWLAVVMIGSKLLDESAADVVDIVVNTKRYDNDDE